MSRVMAGWWGARSDRGELDALIREHRPAIYRLALAITASGDAAEDVAQEVCWRLLRSNDRLDGVEQKWAWIRRITVRCALTEAGKRREPTIPRDVLARSEDPSETLAVAQTLLRLSPEHRTILALAVHEGLSYEEISEVLEIPMGSVASRLHSARARFRELWEDKT